MTTAHVCEPFTDINGFRFGLEKTANQFKTMLANNVEKWDANIHYYHWRDGSFCEKAGLIFNFFEEVT